MNLILKRKTLSISLWVRLEFTMFKKLKWQGLSKKTRSQIYPIKFKSDSYSHKDPIFNNSRIKDSQTYIQIIKKILDNLNQDKLKTGNS